MAVQNAFPWDGGGPYGEFELQTRDKATLRSGVSIKDDTTMTYGVSATGGVITLDPGIAHVNGAWRFDDLKTTYNITPNSSYPYIARVLIVADYVDKTSKKELRLGTPASTPIPPVLTRDATRYEISLAQVYVDTNGKIKITDERTNLDVCGGIRTKDLSEFETYFKGIQKSVEDWFKNQQGTGWTQMFTGESEPIEAVAGAHWFAPRSFK